MVHLLELPPEIVIYEFGLNAAELTCLAQTCHALWDKLREHATSNKSLRLYFVRRDDYDDYAEQFSSTGYMGEAYLDELLSVASAGFIHCFFAHCPHLRSVVLHKAGDLLIKILKKMASKSFVRSAIAAVLHEVNRPDLMIRALYEAILAGNTCLVRTILQVDGELIPAKYMKNYALLSGSEEMVKIMASRSWHTYDICLSYRPEAAPLTLDFYLRHLPSFTTRSCICNAIQHNNMELINEIIRKQGVNCFLPAENYIYLFERYEQKQVFDLLAELHPVGSFEYDDLKSVAALEYIREKGWTLSHKLGTPISSLMPSNLIRLLPSELGGPNMWHDLLYAVIRDKNIALFKELLADRVSSFFLDGIMMDLVESEAYEMARLLLPRVQNPLFGCNRRLTDAVLDTKGRLLTYLHMVTTYSDAYDSRIADILVRVPIHYHMAPMARRLFISLGRIVFKGRGDYLDQAIMNGLPAEIIDFIRRQ